MATHSAAYRRFVRELLHTPKDSVDHHIGDALAVLDDDASLSLLYVMYTADPAPTRAFAIAAEGLSLRGKETVQA